MVIPAPIFCQSITVKPDFTIGQLEVHLDAPALTSCPGHFGDGNGFPFHFSKTRRRANSNSLGPLSPSRRQMGCH